MKKKLLLCMLILVIMLSISACGDGSAPDPKDYTPEDIIAALSENECPVGEITSYDENTDPNGKLGRPNEYVGKADFMIPGIETASSATVETFATKEDCQSRYDYLSAFADPSLGAFGLNQYMYKSDYSILRIPYEVIPTDAATYETVFINFTSK